MPSQDPLILLVDDDEGLCHLIEKALNRLGCRIERCANGTDALAWLQGQDAELMLLDLRLPDINSAELIDTLAAAGRLVPFIVITGQGDERTAVTMMKRGALDYLIKDAEFSELLPMVVQKELEHIANARRLMAAEAAVRERERRFQLMADSASVMIWLAGADGAATWVNQQWLNLTGRKLEDALGNGWMEVVHPDDIDRCNRTYHHAVEARQEFQIDYRVRRHDGEWRWIMNYGRPLWEGGKLAGFVGSCLDITERKQAVEALRLSEQNLAQAQKIAHIGSFEVSLDGPGKQYWSAETFRILGIGPEQAAFTLKEYINTVVHPEDRARLAQQFETAIRGELNFDVEYRVVRPDGQTRHVRTAGQPKRELDGRVSGLVGTLHDVTELRQLEHQILAASDREQNRIGQDLHDGLCQHLAGIEFRLHVLEQDLEGRNKKQAREANELAGMVRQAMEETRAVARGLSPVRIEADGLMTALEELALNTSRLFNVNCTLHCPRDVLVHQNSVAIHLYRIAQEAVQNALRHGKATNVQITLIQSSDRIILSIRDNGSGMAQPITKGDGMGMRVMRYRASIIHGTLTVQREVNGGTCVLCSIRGSQAEPASASGGQTAARGSLAGIA